MKQSYLIFFLFFLFLGRHPVLSRVCPVSSLSRAAGCAVHRWVRQPRGWRPGPSQSLTGASAGHCIRYPSLRIPTCKCSMHQSVSPVSHLLCPQPGGLPSLCWVTAVNSGSTWQPWNGDEGHVFIRYLPVGTQCSQMSSNQFLQLEENFDIYLAQPLHFKSKKTDAQINDLQKV